MNIFRIVLHENVQNETNEFFPIHWIGLQAQESSTVFPSTTPTVSGPSSSPAATDVSNKKVTAKKGAGVAFCNHDQNADCDEEQAEPPASVLTRRRALVPAKLPPYSTDSCEDIELCGTDQGETSIRCAYLHANF